MLTGPTAESVRTPALPTPRGPLSAAAIDIMLGNGPTRPDGARWSAAARQSHPYGDDLQLALYCCYELHYRGFAGVDPDMEWNPVLLDLRGRVEDAFMSALRSDVAGGTDVAAEVDALLVEPVDAHGITHHLCRDGQSWQLREYVAHRSLYHLKEADPHAFAIPRLAGPAKAGLVTVEYDEYGSGDPRRMHIQLFAEMMVDLGLCADYGAYLDAAPPATLAEINLMSMCGLHRRLRGALVGQLATAEIASSPGADRMVKAMQRLGCGPAAIEFYAEHVEADAVHEQLVRRGLIEPLLAAEPGLAGDVVFGIQASNVLAARLSELLLERWAEEYPSLRRPLPDSPG